MYNLILFVHPGTEGWAGGAVYLPDGSSHPQHKGCPLNTDYHPTKTGILLREGGTLGCLFH